MSIIIIVIYNTDQFTVYSSNLADISYEDT